MSRQVEFADLASRWEALALEDAWRFCDGLLDARKGAVDVAAMFAVAREVRALASCDTRPEGGDSTKIEAPFTGGAVTNEVRQTPTTSPSSPSIELDQ